MHSLFLNLASNQEQLDEGACIACVENDQVVTMQYIDHRIDDALLLPELETVLQEANWSMHDIGRIACIIGPGGFTSLRMAVTLCNVLADQLDIPVAGVHLSDVFGIRMCHGVCHSELDELLTNHKRSIDTLRQAPAFAFELRTDRQGDTSSQSEIDPQNSKLKTQNSFLWLHSTRSTHLFVRGFGEYAEKWPEPTLLSIDEFSQQILPTGDEGIFWTGELMPAHRTAFQEKNLKDAPLIPLADALPAFIHSLDYTKQVLEPWYGRGW